MIKLTISSHAHWILENAQALEIKRNESLAKLPVLSGSSFIWKDHFSFQFKEMCWCTSQDSPSQFILIVKQKGKMMETQLRAHRCHLHSHVRISHWGMWGSRVKADAIGPGPQEGHEALFVCFLSPHWGPHTLEGLSWKAMSQGRIQKRLWCGLASVATESSHLSVKDTVRRDQENEAGTSKEHPIHFKEFLEM